MEGFKLILPFLRPIEKFILDSEINEIMVNDVREFVRINNLVRQAKQKGLELLSETGKPYHEHDIAVIRPREPLGDVLDFSRAVIARRLEAGRAAAREFLNATPG